MALICYFVSLFACQVALSHAFPTYPSTVATFPNLQCPCCTSGSIGADSLSISGTSDIMRLVNNMIIYINIAEEHTRTLQRLIVDDRIDDVSAINEITESHWPYVYKLDPNAQSVQQAIDMGEPSAWAILYDQIMKYLKFIHFVTIDEHNWAGRRSGVPLRDVTFEEEAKRLEQPHLANLLCAFRQLLYKKGVPVTDESISTTLLIEYWSEDNTDFSDKRAVIILNSFTNDYLAFLKIYFTEYKKYL